MDLDLDLRQAPENSTCFYSFPSPVLLALVFSFTVSLCFAPLKTLPKILRFLRETFRGRPGGFLFRGTLGVVPVSLPLLGFRRCACLYTMRGCLFGVPRSSLGSSFFQRWSTCSPNGSPYFSIQMVTSFTPWPSLTPPCLHPFCTRQEPSQSLGSVPTQSRLLDPGILYTVVLQKYDHSHWDAVSSALMLLMNLKLPGDTKGPPRCGISPCVPQSSLPVRFCLPHLLCAPSQHTRLCNCPFICFSLCLCFIGFVIHHGFPNGWYGYLKSMHVVEVC